MIFALTGRSGQPQTALPFGSRALYSEPADSGGPDPETVVHHIIFQAESLVEPPFYAEPSAVKRFISILPEPLKPLANGVIAAARRAYMSSHLSIENKRHRDHYQRYLALRNAAVDCGKGHYTEAQVDLLIQAIIEQLTEQSTQAHTLKDAIGSFKSVNDA